MIRRFVSVMGFAWAGVALGSAPGVAQGRSVATAVDVVHSPSYATAESMISVSFDEVPIDEAVRTIAERAGTKVMFASPALPARRVTYRASQVSAEAALLAVLRGTGFTIERTRTGAFKLLPPGNVVVAEGVVTGKVVDAKTKQPIVGATVLLDQATKGIQTGEDGTFRIPATVGVHSVTVRAVGFTKSVRHVTVVEGEIVDVQIVLDASASVLNEVVVTGTVVATARKEIPTPITVITAADIEKRNITRIDQLFRGDVPGVLALDQGSLVYSDQLPDGMATAKVYARGSSTLSGDPNPLKTYVDGVEIVNASYLGTIDPKSIERIEIITGPQAATIYGSGAMGGVMQIFTKKGAGQTSHDVTLNLQYGTLENNISKGLTPLHNHSLALMGGSGPVFSYSGNLSYNYAGQWQPDLFNRMYGASVGATHMQGPVTVSGGISATMGRNGTFSYAWASPLILQLRNTGEWYDYGRQTSSGSVSSSSSLTVSLNADYRQSSAVQHHLTVGRSQTSFDLVPEEPVFSTSADSLFRTQGSVGQRTSGTYSVTVVPRALGIFSTSLALGANGSTGAQTGVNGCLTAVEATTYVNCSGTGNNNIVSITKAQNVTNWGGFGNLRLGFFDQLYVTLGLRGERNRSYGREHSVDWTPTNGIAFTQELGDLTVKLLGSYGRSTRPPTLAMRLGQLTTNSSYNPSNYVTQFEAPNLTPEYSRGPQGGMELYYGNAGSLTINHFQQTVSDLIQRVQVDTIIVIMVATGAPQTIYQYQYQNVAKIRQKGWEATGSFNVMALTVRGTYSWMDSRVVAVNPTAGASYPPGSVFSYVPSHTGSLNVGYAHGGTSVNVVTNYVGSSMQNMFGYGSILGATIGMARIKTYLERYRSLSFPTMKLGYAKTDLAASQRLSPWASAILNVTNVSNSYGTEADLIYPTTGRQTSFGLSLRFPRNR